MSAWAVAIYLGLGLLYAGACVGAAVAAPGVFGPTTLVVKLKIVALLLLAAVAWPAVIVFSIGYAIAGRLSK